MSGVINLETQQKISSLRVSAQQLALRTGRLERRERLLEEQRLEIDDVHQRSLLSAAVGPEAAIEARAVRIAERRVAVADAESRNTEETRAKRWRLDELQAEIDQCTAESQKVKMQVDQAETELVSAQEAAAQCRADSGQLERDSLKLEARCKEVEIRELSVCCIDEGLNLATTDFKREIWPRVIDGGVGFASLIDFVAERIADGLLKSDHYSQRLSELVSLVLQNPDVAVLIPGECTELPTASELRGVDDSLADSPTNDSAHHSFGSIIMTPGPTLNATSANEGSKGLDKVTDKAGQVPSTEVGAATLEVYAGCGAAEALYTPSACWIHDIGAGRAGREVVALSPTLEDSSPISIAVSSSPPISSRNCCPLTVPSEMTPRRRTSPADLPSNRARREAVIDAAVAVAEEITAARGRSPRRTACVVPGFVTPAAAVSRPAQKVWAGSAIISPPGSLACPPGACVSPSGVKECSWALSGSIPHIPKRPNAGSPSTHGSPAMCSSATSSLVPSAARPLVTGERQVGYPTQTLNTQLTSQLRQPSHQPTMNAQQHSTHICRIAPGPVPSASSVPVVRNFTGSAVIRVVSPVVTVRQCASINYPLPSARYC